MKDSQWAMAVGVLAALVFIIVFAGQYLGGGPGGKPTPAASAPQRELTFANKSFPESDEAGPVELEVKGHSEAVFQFVNADEKPILAGLIRTTCTCTEAELYVLPAVAPKRLGHVAAALTGYAAGGALHAIGPCGLALKAATAAATRYELRKGTEGAVIPGGAVGWVRLGWHAERAGSQALGASIWMEDPKAGKTASLEIRSFAHEPFRVLPTLSFGTVREADLRDGVHGELVVWSATRPSFRIDVSPGSVRTDPKSDPMELGAARPLSAAERLEYERSTPELAEAARGVVRGAWRVPLTLRAVAADGTTPFDIGAFKRTLLVSSPDFPEVEPKPVSVTGRVRGAVEVGNDGEGAEVNFSTFPRKRGKAEGVNLSSDVAGLDLKVDAARTSKFLDAALEPPQAVGGTRRQWRLKVAVKPGAASGPFPRKDDPLYEDSAVYLIGTAPGQTPRAVRVAVFGTATE